MTKKTLARSLCSAAVVSWLLVGWLAFNFFPPRPQYRPGPHPEFDSGRLMGGGPARFSGGTNRWNGGSGQFGP
jgi:hypothetical protein